MVPAWLMPAEFNKPVDLRKSSKEVRVSFGRRHIIVKETQNSRSALLGGLLCKTMIIGGGCGARLNGPVGVKIRASQIWGNEAGGKGKEGDRFGEIKQILHT